MIESSGYQDGGKKSLETRERELRRRDVRAARAEPAIIFRRAPDFICSPSSHFLPLTLFSDGRQSRIDTTVNRELAFWSNIHMAFAEPCHGRHPELPPSATTEQTMQAFSGKSNIFPMELYVHEDLCMKRRMADPSIAADCRAACPSSLGGDISLKPI